MLCDKFAYFLQAVGVTSALPEDIPSSLFQAASNEWIYRGNQLLHNAAQTNFPSLPSLDGLICGDSVGLFIDNTGSLHVFFNGAFSGTIATELPTNKRLWGVVDLFGDCSKITSVMLSGRLV